MSAGPELATQLDAERAEAIQHLLRRPLLDARAQHDAYTLVVRHGEWLVRWYDDTCGWALHVDAAAGFARLAKRQADPDPTRPLRRLRGSGAPFDRRRYQLLCLVSAELVSHPVTTVGLLARAVAAAGAFTPERHRDRVAFVDALLVLRSWRAVEVSSGEVEDYVGNEKANALLTADLARLQRLLAPATAPSRLDPAAPFDDALSALLAEPRYDGAHLDAGDPHRATRHRLARRLLDDPVLHLDECTDDERDYLASGAGRTWLRQRVAAAGLVLEERSDGLLAVDPAARSTDDTFPGPNGTVHQMALLLVDHLVSDTLADGAVLATAADAAVSASRGATGAVGFDPSSSVAAASGPSEAPGTAGGDWGGGPSGVGDPVAPTSRVVDVRASSSLTASATAPTDVASAAGRRARTRTRTELVAAVAERLAAHPKWAKAYQEPGGAERLADESVALLAAFGLVRRSPDGALVEARPALCRYQPGTLRGVGAAPRARRRPGRADHEGPDPAAPTLFDDA